MQKIISRLLELFQKHGVTRLYHICHSRFSQYQKIQEIRMVASQRKGKILC